MSEQDLRKIRNLGSHSINQLQEQIDLLYEQGEDYFTVHVSEDSTAVIEGQENLTFGKGFDFHVIDTLVERFSFKPVRMTKWFSLSRQGIYNALERRNPRRQEIWTGKELSDSEYTILFSLIESRKFDYSDDVVTCCCMNNSQGELACLFIYENEIKCFFLEDLTEELRQIIEEIHFNKYTERELAGESDGDVVYSIKKPYFIPKYPDKFRSNAAVRGMSSDEYAMFISGYPIGDVRSKTDDQIISFFEENLVDGKVYISSDPKNQWIKSLASRNGYSIKDFIELYGYKSRLDGTQLTAEGARKRHIEELKKYIVRDNIVYFPTYSKISRVLTSYCYNKGLTINDYIKSLGFERTTVRPKEKQDTLERDMQIRENHGRFEEKIFARYPLLGSKILKQETTDKLNEISKKYIDTVLREPKSKLSLQAEMQITLALINNAKNWKSEENSQFWNYISLQFGYRDTSGAVVRLLQNSLENALKKNGRLFLENENGREFKATAVIHALSTRKSWMKLLDFLFDFYKNNLNWEIIPEDPLLSVMVRALQQKLGDDNADDVELTINYNVYLFQEGIRKLILFRPAYTRNLFERLIRKIDNMINSEDSPVKTYEEQLCEEWFKEKIISIANARKTERQGQTGQRDVAIDYSRIRAKLILKNENDLQLVLPDIRLEKDTLREAVLSIYYGETGTPIYQKNLSWYGNELGKTLNGVSVSLPSFPNCFTDIDIRVTICCDEEIIYDSEDTLQHHLFVFYGSTEVGTSQIKKDNYTLVLPQKVELKAENTEITDIDNFKVNGLKAYFLELKDGYIVTVNGKLIAFDSAGGTDVKILVPQESMSLPTVRSEDSEYVFAYHGSACNIILGNEDFLQQYVVLKNGERIEFSELPSLENGKGLVFSCPIDGPEDTCRIQVISLANERLIFDQGFIIVHNVNGCFNREFYYSATDYQEASYTITIDNHSETVFFSKEDDEVRIPYRDGEIHVPIPKILVEETTGSWMNGSVPAWYIGDIPQNSMLKVENMAKANVRFIVDGKDILYDGQGLVTLGNVLHSSAGNDSFSMTEIIMAVNGTKQNEHYQLARVCYKEQFLKIPTFWTEDNLLYWDQGVAFIGKPGRSFTVSLYGKDDTPYELSFDENTEYAMIPEEMPVGNYHYEISILSGGLFKRVKEIIAEGDCIIGDLNLLRFMNRRIVIEAITDEFNEEAGHITIRTCYIDQIEYIGMEDTSEGYCPVYRGVLYTTGYHGERYEFSYDNHTNNRGVTKIVVNPVRIVCVGDNSLCITDSDGDGLYYYYYYDRYLESTVFALTDREYSKTNRHKYSNADLYSYRTERI